ncbi:MAG TPA: amino acid permease, partial [Candidatus Polarisedimenticolia bacterium]|nr:amino acid permease [Candidatus Polarisedimenticolia bacterium]
MTGKEGKGLVKGLGPISATALVAGNIIGSGIFVIPASLADVAGPLSLVAWVLVAGGFLCLTSVYADLSSAYPVSGGMQVYAQRAFGDLAGLET